MIDEEVSYRYDYDGIAFHLLENIWDSVSTMPEFEDIDHNVDHLFEDWAERWSDEIIKGIERCIENGTLNTEDEWVKFHNDVKNSDVRKILSNAKNDLIKVFEGDNMDESRRPSGHMLRESDDNTYDVRLREIFRTVQDSRNQINKLYDRLDRFVIALDKSDKREILDDLMDMEETIKGLERKLS